MSGNITHLCSYATAVKNVQNNCKGTNESGNVCGEEKRYCSNPLSVRVEMEKYNVDFPFLRRTAPTEFRQQVNETPKGLTYGFTEIASAFSGGDAGGSHTVKADVAKQRYAEKLQQPLDFVSTSAVPGNTELHNWIEKQNKYAKHQAWLDSLSPTSYPGDNSYQSSHKRVEQVHEVNAKNSKTRYEEEFDPKEVVKVSSNKYSRFISSVKRIVRKKEKNPAVQELSKRGKGNKNPQKFPEVSTEEKKEEAKGSSQKQHSHFYKPGTSAARQTPIHRRPLALTKGEIETLHASNPVMNPGREFIVRRRELQELVDDNESWLDENIIDAYIRQMLEDEESNTLNHVSVQLINFLGNDTSIRPPQSRFTVHQGLINNMVVTRRILFPIYLNHHYFLMVGDIEQGKITVYDSLSLSSLRIRSHVDVAKHISKALDMKIGARTWKLGWSQNAPLQQNGYDCGLFVLHNAHSVITDEYLETFGSLHAVLLRNTIKARFEKEYRLMKSLPCEEKQEQPQASPQPDIVWTTPIGGIVVPNLNIGPATTHGVTSNVEYSEKKKIETTVDAGFHNQLTQDERAARYQKITSRFQVKQSEHLLRTRQYMRIEGLIRAAIRRGVSPDEFGNIDVLHRHDPSKRTRTQFRDFLRLLHAPDILTVIYITLKMLQISNEDRWKICGNLSHFACERRGKGHNDLCVLDNKDLFDLRQQEALAVVTDNLDETSEELVEESTQDHYEAGTTSGSSEEPEILELEDPEEENVHTSFREKKIRKSSSSSDDTCERPTRTRRPPQKFSPSEYQSSSKQHKADDKYKSVSKNKGNNSKETDYQRTPSQHHTVISDYERNLQLDTTGSSCSSEEERSASPVAHSSLKQRLKTPVKTSSDEVSISEEEIIMVKDTPTKSVQNYVHPKEIHINIPFVEWHPYWDDKNNVPKGRWAVIIDKFFKEIPIACAFKAKTYDRLAKNSEKGIVKLRGYCQKDGGECQCKSQFTLFVKSVDLKEGVQIEGTVHCPGGFNLFQTTKSGRPVAGEERQSARRVLFHQKAKSLLLKTTDDTKSVQFVHKNFPSQSESVYRKIRSEAITEGMKKEKNIDSAIAELHKHFLQHKDFQYPQHPELNGYLRRVSSVPHVNQLASPSQLRFATLCDTIYFDATGSVVPKMKTDVGTREILLHSAIGKNSKKSDIPGVPLFEVLSSRATADEVEAMMTHFLHDMKTVSPTWRPKMVVVDFCLAYLHGLVLALCGETLSDYINRKWDLLYEESSKVDKPTVIFVCSGHIMFAVSRDVRKKSVDKNQIKVALHAFASLIELRGTTALDSWITKVISVFGNPHLPEEILNEYVSELVWNTEAFDEDEFRRLYEITLKCDEELDEYFPSIDPKLEREKSRFFVKFSRTRERHQSVFETMDAEERNEYYNRGILDMFERWITYLPFFSKLSFYSHNSVPEETITTGFVEGYFQQLKHIFHLRRRVYEPLFIKSHAEVALQSVQYALRVGSTAKKLSAKAKSILNMTVETPVANDDEPLSFDPTASQNVTAVWKPKKSKKKVTYFQSLKKAKEQYSSSNTDNTSKGLTRKKKASTSPSHLATNSKEKRGKSVVQSQKRSKEGKEKNLVDLVEPESPDEFELGNMRWISEAQELCLFHTLFQKEEGTERDMLTLKSETMVNCRVASAVAHLIVQDVKGKYTQQATYRAVDSAIVSESPTKPYEIVCNPQVLPTPTSVDLTSAQLFLISFMRNHAWLTLINTNDHEITYYDSLPGYIKPNQRNKYFDKLKTALEDRYSLGGWEVKQGETQNQEGVECVIMSLLRLETLLGAQEKATDLVSCDDKRKAYAKKLLAEHENGWKVLVNNQHDWDLILSKFERREREREKHARFFARKKEIRKLETSYHKNPDPQLSKEISAMKLELIADIKYYDDSYYEDSFPGPVEFFV